MTPSVSHCSMSMHEPSLHRELHVRVLLAEALQDAGQPAAEMLV